MITRWSARAIGLLEREWITGTSEPEVAFLWDSRRRPRPGNARVSPLTHRHVLL